MLRESPCLVSRLRWNGLLLAFVCTVARCSSKSFVSISLWGSSMPCSRTLHTALCSTVSNDCLKFVTTEQWHVQMQRVVGGCGDRGGARDSRSRVGGVGGQLLTAMPLTKPADGAARAYQSESIAPGRRLRPRSWRRQRGLELRCGCKSRVDVCHGVAAIASGSCHHAH